MNTLYEFIGVVVIAVMGVLIWSGVWTLLVAGIEAMGYHIAF